MDDNKIQMASGTKHDNNKPSMSLIDPDFLEGLAKVLDFGEKKYNPHNWRRGISVSRLIDACYRHLGEINRRHDVDSESNLPAVYHLAAEVMFLAWTLENRKNLDDRYKDPARLPTIKDMGYPSSYHYPHPKANPHVVKIEPYNLGEHPA